MKNTRKASYSLILLVFLLVLGFSGCKKEEETKETTAEANVASEAENTEVTEEATESGTETATPEVEVVAEEEKEVGITDGIFEYSIENEGNTYANYINFYENGIYYYSKYNDKQFFAGYYEILDERIDILSTGAVSGADYQETITCAQKIVFYDLDGTTVLGEAGFNNDGIIVGVTLQDSHDFVQNLETEHSQEDETGVAIAEFFLEGDEYSYVSLKHNGTFEDTLATLIAGTWTKEDNVYTLTDEMTQGTYTITDLGDKTATYKGQDGTELTLTLPVELAVKTTFEGTLEASYGEMKGTILCYEDGSASMNISYAGTENVYQGTWELAADYSKITVVVDGNSYEAPRAEDNSFSFEYPTTDGAGDVILVFITVQ